MDASANLDRVAFLLNQLKGLREDLAGARWDDEAEYLRNAIRATEHSLWLAGHKEVPA
jgi:hypothetical protein